MRYRRSGMMTVDDALQAIRNQPNVYLITIVNGDHKEIPVSYMTGHAVAMWMVDLELEAQRELDVPDPNYSVRARDHKGTIRKSRRI